MYEEGAKKKVNIDERLFERISMGDEEAFKELYELSYKPLYAFLLSLTQNAEDAQDLLQDTFVQVFNHSHKYQNKGNPMAWMSVSTLLNLTLVSPRRLPISSTIRLY